MLKEQIFSECFGYCKNCAITMFLIYSTAISEKGLTYHQIIACFYNFWLQLNWKREVDGGCYPLMKIKRNKPHPIANVFYEGVQKRKLKKGSKYVLSARRPHNAFLARYIANVGLYRLTLKSFPFL